MIKKIFYLLIATILVVIGILFFNFGMFTKVQKNYNKLEAIEIPDRVVRNLSDAIKIKTVSYDSLPLIDHSQLLRLHDFLQERFPLVDSMLEREVVAKYSLLYKWTGTKPELAPIVLTGHMDVVPVEEISASQWKEPAFEGKVVDGVIWGRGVIDDKGAVLGILESIELLLGQGFRPDRTVYLAFGHDEETAGTGARALAKNLENKGIHAEMVMDEGLVITRGIVPGIQQDVALVGISEKGYLSLELIAEQEGGHSSMPAKETAIDVLMTALENMRRAPFELEITEPVSAFMKTMGPEMPFVNKLAFSNRWLMKPIIMGVYSSAPSSNAMVQTTMVPTILESGVKDNVIPTQAKAIVNFRILPGTTTDEVIAHVKDAINDPRISIKRYGISMEASPVSSYTSHGFLAIEKAVRELNDEVLVTPSLMIAYTDGRLYTAITDNIYRFLPVTFADGELSMMHGINEHITIDNYKQSIRYYIGIIKNASAENLQ